MIEQVLNLFVYIEGDVVEEVGVSVHDVDGNDQEKIALLQGLVEPDSKTATRYRLVSPIQRFRLEVLMRLRQHGALFEDIFRRYGENSLFVLTPLLNGEPIFRRANDPQEDVCRR